MEMGTASNPQANFKLPIENEKKMNSQGMYLELEWLAVPQGLLGQGKGQPRGNKMR